jgi:beta-glucosidase
MACFLQYQNHRSMRFQFLHKKCHLPAMLMLGWLSPFAQEPTSTRIQPDTTSFQLTAYKNSNLDTEVRIRDLMSRMNPEEKFWQLFMVAESWDVPKERYSQGAFGFEGGVAEGKVGDQLISIEAAGGATALVNRINAAQGFFTEKTRLGIPIIPFGETLHGLVHEGAASFPQSIGLAATFDTALMHRVASAIAQETRACGVRMVLSPVVNIADDPRWGRTEETYGEDPWLSSAMGVAFVSAFEKAGIITCPKHFVANAGAGGRDSYPIHSNERQLEEVYFPPFKACIKSGGSRSVMAAYNSLDGTPCTANDWLLNKKLKQEWDFGGFVISDAGATGGSNCLHMTARDYYESTVDAMNNGLDVIFQTDFEHYKLFQPPFLDGKIKEQAIDQAVYRVLKAKFQLGLFDKPYADSIAAATCFGNPAHLALARETARKSIVLLKNDRNALPISKSIRSVAVIGPDAVEARLGGYSGPGFRKVSILEGIREKLGNSAAVHYSPGCARASVEYDVVSPAFLSHVENGKTFPGLKGAYFNDITMAGSPVLMRIDSEINFRWTLYSPDPLVNYDWFSVRWTGFITFPFDTSTRIGIAGNDGFRVYLDDQLVLKSPDRGTFASQFHSRHFEGGRSYRLRIEFMENSGSAWFKLVWGNGNQITEEGWMADALETARKCEHIIFVAGIVEGEGLDRACLHLPGRQEELILRLAALGKPMAVVLCGGSAITMDRWLEKVPSVIDCWYPGEQGGHAVADVLFGDYNPAGRLPITFPMSVGQLPLTYNHKPTGRNDDYGDISGEALFPFGYGLSYTSFEYSDLEVIRADIKAGEKTAVRFRLKNNGKLAGEEVVQLYIKDVFASVARPLKELKACQRVFLEASENKIITFEITPGMLTMLDAELKPVIEPGEFRLLIGASSKDIRLRGIVDVE